ncbi:hypothetical protein MM59RIKEN_19050 [Pusillibacter faecalis]|uniref:Uncharacterized protein n=1 Tax=Pusillibacter faecalis TaxID=2714358 RepID=A0A810QFE9_9FIRM|nr:hypothetical protein MM59RIKEN_19050 [Pusillibacter faecalis]
MAASRVRGEVMRAMRGRRIGYQPKKSMTIAISRSAASSSANRDVAAQAIPAARGPHSSKTGSNAAIASTGAQKVARGSSPPQQQNDHGQSGQHPAQGHPAAGVHSGIS